VLCCALLWPQVVESSPGFKRVEVEQVGELRVMWISRAFKTYLDVTEDCRDPECLKTDFTLLRSVSVLRRRDGGWGVGDIACSPMGEDGVWALQVGGLSAGLSGVAVALQVLECGLGVGYSEPSRRPGT
jgi:hypothetical protein